ncbi:hypothetical protein PQX77_017480 [Marasmius sp. AFHP31]|nr:hypothetical protein PQX77_017480 [Marasmius sp. AFHP31]
METAVDQSTGGMASNLTPVPPCQPTSHPGVPLSAIPGLVDSDIMMQTIINHPVEGTTANPTQAPPSHPTSNPGAPVSAIPNQGLVGSDVVMPTIADHPVEDTTVNPMQGPPSQLTSDPGAPVLAVPLKDSDVPMQPIVDRPVGRMSSNPTSGPSQTGDDHTSATATQPSNDSVTAMPTGELLFLLDPSQEQPIAVLQGQPACQLPTQQPPTRQPPPPCQPTPILSSRLTALTAGGKVKTKARGQGPKQAQARHQGEKGGGEGQSAVRPTDTATVLAAGAMYGQGTRGKHGSLASTVSITLTGSKQSARLKEKKNK